MVGQPTKELRDLVRQEIIDFLAARAKVRSPGEVVTDLLHELGRNDLPSMPLPWVRAVAESAAVGNAYVISPLTRRTDSADS